MKKFDFDNPVTILTGNEFLPKEGITFAEQILHFFQSQGGVAHSPWGEVLLDKKGIQSDKSHGVGRIKAASFAAIKDVLEKGEIILPLDYYATNGKKKKSRRLLHLAWFVAVALRHRNPWEALQRYSRDS